MKNTQYWRLIDPEGKPPGFLGWWPSKAVTFVDNHDTGWAATLRTADIPACCRPLAVPGVLCLCPIITCVPLLGIVSLLILE